jgi:hypothetical protein
VVSLSLADLQTFDWYLYAQSQRSDPRLYLSQQKYLMSMCLVAPLDLLLLKKKTVDLLSQYKVSGIKMLSTILLIRVQTSLTRLPAQWPYNMLKTQPILSMMQLKFVWSFSTI